MLKCGLKLAFLARIAAATILLTEGFGLRRATGGTRSNDRGETCRQNAPQPCSGKAHTAVRTSLS